MNLKLIALAALSTGFVSKTFAAAETCFEFTTLSVDRAGVDPQPAVVLKRFRRDNGEVIVFKQEVVALNELAQDALQGLHEGDTVCLKGTRSYTAYAKYLAYAVRKQ